MKGDDVNSSILVIGSFIFLFFVFILLNQPKPTGYVPLIGSFENFSVLSLVIIVVILLVVLGVAFIFYKKVRGDKAKGQKIPKPPEKRENIPTPGPLGGLEKEVEPAPSKKPTESAELSEKEIESLFGEPAEEEREEAKEHVGEKTEVKEKTEPKLDLSEMGIAPEKPKEVEEDISKLKAVILNLMSKNYNKDQVISYLQSKGFNIGQITKAINQINSENLQNYINSMLKMGFTKQQVITALKAKGWQLQEIQKVLT